MNDSLTPAYFDEIYRRNSDPWDFATSDYEAAKYAATLNALPSAREFENAFEVGCSIGVLTERLAARCRRLLAVDLADAALVEARARLRHLPHVRLERRRVPQDFPAETFDLIVLSEVGYYLSPEDWRATTEKCLAQIAPRGVIALAHWTPRVHDYPQTGDAVHDSFAEWSARRLHLISSARQETYRLDVWENAVA